MQPLTREKFAEIAATNDRPAETVNVPEWDVSITLRGLTAGDKQRYEDSLVPFDASGKATINTRDGMARLLVLSIVGDDGAPVFTDADITAFSERSGAVIARLAKVAQRLSGLGGDEFVAAKND